MIEFEIVPKPFKMTSCELDDCKEIYTNKN